MTGDPPVVRRAGRRPLRRRTWVLVGVVVAVAVVVGVVLGTSGPIEWFSHFSVSPTVAYSGDVNVTLTATLVGLAGPIPGVVVRFIAFAGAGTPAVVVGTAVTDTHGVATAHFRPEAPLTLRLFAQARLPGTSTTVTSTPAILQVFLPPTL